ncbi:MAG: hypothetical protein ABGX07_04895 [Pirellulaceae bacterium]|nr:hypothetical protein [Planctomycetota bacterium]
MWRPAYGTIERRQFYWHRFAEIFWPLWAVVVVVVVGFVFGYILYDATLTGIRAHRRRRAVGHGVESLTA